MLNDTRQQTALIGLTNGKRLFEHGSPESVTLREVPFAQLVNLRGNPKDIAFLETIQNTIGITLPTEPNTIAKNDRCCAYWLAPDEWMIQQTDSSSNDLASKLDMALQGIFCAVTDQSSAYSVLHLQGVKSRNVLAKGCPLDLHPRVFNAKLCAQSHYYKTSILLRRLSETDSEQWEVIVRRSFADYAVRMMVDGMWEYAEEQLR